MTVPRPAEVHVGTPTGPPPARLSSRSLPGRRDVREVRLMAEPGALVLRRGSAELRRITVGPDGQARTAVHVGGPVFRDVAPGSLGAVDLLDADGGRLVRIDLGDWVPEAVELLDPDTALDRSGLVPLLEHAGLPLRPVPESALSEALTATPPVLAPRRGLPLAYTVLRSAAVAVCFVGLVVARFADRTGPLALGAALLLLSTVAALALWARAALQDRLPLAPPLLRPHPSVPVTRRFRAVARLLARDDEVVVVDGLGRERHLPRTGPHGVVSVAVVRDGTPTAQVELRTGSGVPRATLPWDAWVAGPGGEAALARLCAESGLHLERGAPPARSSPAQEERARAVHSSPLPAVVTAELTYPKGLPGPAATWQSSAFAVLLLVLAVGAEASGTRAIAALTLALSAGPPLVCLLARRLWLDRPVQP